MGKMSRKRKREKPKFFAGLKEEEAEKRLKIYGFNEIKGKEIGAKEVLARQFRSPFFIFFLARRWFLF
jgi:magnesium-transporting ATPase (P-type)